MKESPISALYDALLPSLKQHAPKDKTLELLRYYCDKIYQEGELNGRIQLGRKLKDESDRTFGNVKQLIYTELDADEQRLKSQLERKEQ